MKRIQLNLPDDSKVVLDEQTSEAIYLYARAKGISIDKAVEEVLVNFIKKLKENQSVQSGE
jgi:hypothetical protein